MSLGSTLRAAREAKGLTLRAVQAATGVSNACVSQLESGRIKNPSAFFLHKLAMLYGIGFESLVKLVSYGSHRVGPGVKGPLPKAVLLAEMIGSDQEAEELMRYLQFMRKRV